MEKLQKCVNFILTVPVFFATSCTKSSVLFNQICLETSRFSFEIIRTSKLRRQNLIRQDLQELYNNNLVMNYDEDFLPII
jgi:hypothetical protein